MADGRILHKKGSHGERIIALDHLDFRVWVQYVLSADDYGVMRASASVLMADNPRLEREPVRRLERAMAAIVTSGLVQTFTHQGVTFWWQDDWQDFQGIRHPRGTVNPAPSQEAIQTATKKTRELFAQRPVIDREDFGKVSEKVQTPARAGGRETLTLTLTPTPQGSGSSEESARETTAMARRDSVPPVFAPPRGRRGVSLAGSHLGCYPTPDACGRGVCVPAWLGREWLQQFADQAEGERVIAAVVEATVRDLPDGPIGDEPKVFWRAVWKAVHGSKASRGGSRTGDSVDAARAFMAERVAALRASGG